MKYGPRRGARWCLRAVWLGILAVYCGQASAAGQLLFASTRNGNLDIFVMTADGRGVRALTGQGANETVPTWSPTGEFFAYASDSAGNFDIWVAKADGSDPEQLTHEPSLDWGPDWSPDGSRLAFVSERDGGRDIYTIELSERRVERITRTPGLWKGWVRLAWSPAGRRLAFDAHPVVAFGDWDIYTVNADGTGQRRIIDMPLHATMPRWSRDGASLLFSSSGPAGGSDIYRGDADGEARDNLTQDADLDDDPEPLTAPDAFAFRSDRDSAPGHIDIHVLRTDSGERVNITEHPSANGASAWFDPALLPVPVRGAALTTWGWLRRLQRAR